MASGVSVNEVKCPSCNGPLDISGGTGAVTCAYCGSTVHVSVQEPEPSGIDDDGAIRDRATGRGLFVVPELPGWHVTGTSLRQLGSSSRPYLPHAMLRNRGNAFMEIRLGDGGMKQSTGLKVLMGVYGGHLNGIDTANYADVPDPRQVADDEARALASKLGASQLAFERQLPWPNLEAVGQREYANAQRNVVGGPVTNPLTAGVVRVYDATVAGKPFKVATSALLTCVKDAMNVGGVPGLPGLGGTGGGLGGLAGAFGGLFGRKNAAPAPATMPPAGAQAARAPQPGARQPMVWSIPAYAPYIASGNIVWSIGPVVTLVGPAEGFGPLVGDMLLPLLASIQLHDDVQDLARAFLQQEAGMINQATQTQLARNQAAFEAQQAAIRQMQASFDSYNQSIREAGDAHHRRLMSDSAAQRSHSAPDFSEAIRGVNTYTTSDGREVQVSVSADRAFENQSGDVIGWSSSFDPGSDWTEIPRT